MVVDNGMLAINRFNILNHYSFSFKTSKLLSCVQFYENVKKKTLKSGRKKVEEKVRNQKSYSPYETIKQQEPDQTSSPSQD